VPSPRLLACLAGAFVGLALVAAGCDGDPPDSSLRTSRAAPVPVGPAEVADGAPEPRAAIAVGGHVTRDDGEPIVGRPIVIVDTTGQRIATLTDEAGGFHATGVAPPYDVAVGQAPSGAVITPVLFLGLSRKDPRLEVFERHGPSPRASSQSIAVGVRLPRCRATVGACWVSVVSASPSGSGATAGSYIEGAETAVYQVDHAWNAESTRAGETIDVHVLAGSADYSEYAYARVSRIDARPGRPTDIGMTTPMPIEATPPVTLASYSRVPATWQWTLASWVDLPGSASIALRYDWAPSSTLRLPKLPGATFRAVAWAQHPPDESRPYFHASSSARTGTLPIAVENVALEVPEPPEPVRPAVEGILSRTGAGVAFRPRPPALPGGRGLYSLVLVDVGRGRQVARIYASEPEIPLARMEALGVASLSVGAHVLDLTATGGADVDAFADPDPRARAQRFDAAVAGATTYQRFRFDVTP